MTKVLWFTGLSGSGKSTVAERLKTHLDRFGKSYKIFDGDDIRERLHKHLGFTPEDIKENNRLIVELCKEKIGGVDCIIVPIISPFKESREAARKIFENDFVEVYFNCPYDKCRKRDVKGLYKKAHEGELKNFIGLHVPYEPPENPEIEIDSVNENIEESVDKILDFLGLI